MTKARDIADFKFENITDTGTEGTKLASGTTAQRGSTPGQFRYNSTTGKFEGRNSSSFVSIEVTPTVSSINVSNITQVQIDAGFDIVITGENFASGDVVTFVGNDNTEYTASTVTIDSSTQITARITSTIDSTKEPYAVRVTSAGGLTGSLASAFNIDAKPVWQQAAGSLGNIFDSQRSSVNITTNATDAEGDTITYSETTSVLSGLGLSLNTSTGAITGSTAAVSVDTTSNFTLRATSGSQSTDRNFSITRKPPQEQSFTYTGATQTFSVPTGITAITAYVWGAGGGGAAVGGWATAHSGGGGGAAVGTINVSGITSLAMVVGQGGEGQDNQDATTIRMSFGGGGGNDYTGDNKYSGGGGGLSGVFNGSYTHGTSLLIAGGGGGGGNRSQGTGNSVGGAGGGSTGQDGNSQNGTGQRGRGGTQSAGGAGGDQNTNSQADGAALQGGYNPSSQYGGGGGGGYYGGGAGAYYGSQGVMGGGGGGSGYFHPTLVTSATLYQGSGVTPGNSSNSKRSGAGDGGTAGGTSGGDGDNGRIVIVY